MNCSNGNSLVIGLVMKKDLSMTEMGLSIGGYVKTLQKKHLRN